MLSTLDIHFVFKQEEQWHCRFTNLRRIFLEGFASLKSVARIRGTEVYSGNKGFIDSSALSDRNRRQWRRHCLE